MITLLVQSWMGIPQVIQLNTSQFAVFKTEDKSQKIMDADFLTDCVTCYCFLDGKGRVNSVSLVQLVQKQKLKGSVQMFNRADLHDYNFLLIQQSATVSPRMFAHELNAMLHLQLHQHIAP